MNRLWTILLAFCGCLRLAAASSVEGPAEPGTNQWTERVMLPVGHGKWIGTAVGYDHSGPAPWTDGNCLSFMAGASELKGRPTGKADVVNWRICNIHAENFHEITKRLRLTSVEAEVIHRALLMQTNLVAEGRQTVQVVDAGDCIITDQRIPRKWFRAAPCVCLAYERWLDYLVTYPDRINGDAVGAECARQITRLISPTLLANLGGAGERVQKCVCWLAVARQGGQSEPEVIDAAQQRHTVSKARKDLTKTMLLRNLDIADRLGCLDAEGMAEMRQGKAATVRRGPYQGEPLGVTHIIPQAVCPELDNCIANRELMPARLSESKGNRVEAWQVGWARQLHEAGLLSDKGLRAVEKAARIRR